MDPARFRDEFPGSQHTVFFNHAGISPLPRRTLAAMTAHLADRADNGSRHYPLWMEEEAKTRELAAGLIGARPEDIALTGNTSTGLSLVASGIDWRPGDRVVVSAPDFPSVVYPWLNLARRGVTVEFLARRDGAIVPGDVDAALARGARLLCLAGTDFVTGFAADLESLGALCRDRGVLFCLDAIQDLGIRPIDVVRARVDFLAAGGHKWLLGPMGAGILYVSPNAADQLHPVLAGWKSVTGDRDFGLHFELKTSAARFEPGSQDLAAILGLSASLSLLLEAGIEPVREKALGYLDMLEDGLSGRGYRVLTPRQRQHRSGILTFVPPRTGQAEALFEHLTRQRVALAPRGPGLRVSPHYYANEDDAGRFFAALDSFGG